MNAKLVGHEKQLQQFRERLARNRLASTFLLAGPEGIGKRAFAYYVAQCLLCENLIDMTIPVKISYFESL